MARLAISALLLLAGLSVAARADDNDQKLDSMAEEYLLKSRGIQVVVGFRIGYAEGVHEARVFVWRLHTTRSEDGIEREEIEEVVNEVSCVLRCPLLLTF